MQKKITFSSCSLFFYGFPIFRPALMLSSYYCFSSESIPLRKVQNGRASIQIIFEIIVFQVALKLRPPENALVSTPINCDPFDGHSDLFASNWSGNELAIMPLGPFQFRSGQHNANKLKLTAKRSLALARNPNCLLLQPAGVNVRNLKRTIHLHLVV